MSLDGYRFGYQGSEKDNEFKGEGNSYTTEFRQLDPRLGRWLTIDPKASKYPNESPYIAFRNNPIYFSDPRGDDPPDLKILFQQLSQSKTFLKLASAANISESTIKTIVSYSYRTATNNMTGEIVIKTSESFSKLAAGMAHEFTNRKNLKKLQELSIDMRWGIISPEEYAKKILDVEVEATVNQIIVLSELKLLYEGEGSEFFNPLIEEYSKGDRSKKDLTKTIQDNIYNAVGEDGTFHFETYTQDGKDMYKATEKSRIMLGNQKSIEKRAESEKKKVKNLRNEAGLN